VAPMFFSGRWWSEKYECLIWDARKTTEKKSQFQHIGRRIGPGRRGFKQKRGEKRGDQGTVPSHSFTPSFGYMICTENRDGGKVESQGGESKGKAKKKKFNDVTVTILKGVKPLRGELLGRVFGAEGGGGRGRGGGGALGQRDIILRKKKQPPLKH